MKEINEYELVMLYYEKSEEAEKILLKHFELIIKSIIRKESEALKKVGIDHKELFNECFSLFNEIMSSYTPERNATFSTFAKIIINRKIQQKLIKSRRIKNRFLINSISLNDPIYDSTIRDFIKDENSIDPLNKIIMEETNKEITKSIIKNLSKSELQVYDLILEGVSLEEITKRLNKSYKQVTNAKERIKKKIKQMLLAINEDI